MKEKERISNLEELMAEVLMRLDKLETGQSRLEVGQAKLQIGQAKLENGQAKLEIGQAKLEIGQSGLENGQITLQTAMLDLVKVVRKTSIDIEYLKENMATKDGLNNLFEAMMSRFDKSDRRMDEMQADIDDLKKR
jgi:exonuclease VII small subunit